MKYICTHSYLTFLCKPIFKLILSYAQHPKSFFYGPSLFNGQLFIKFQKKKVVKSSRVADLPIKKLVK